MAKVTFVRVDADEYQILVDDRPAGGLYRDEDEDFVTPSSFEVKRYYVWDFRDFDGDLSDGVANMLEREIQQVRGLNVAKRIVRGFFAS